MGMWVVVALFIATAVLLARFGQSKWMALILIAFGYSLGVNPETKDIVGVIAASVLALFHHFMSII